MAQRNPMNQRYAGDGPKGQTRKSAAKLKPKSEAAASVHIEQAPTTKAERKAAHKKRDRELARKEEERKKKIAEREKAEKEAKIAAGELPPEPEGKKAKKANDKTLLQQGKDILGFTSNDKKTVNPNIPQTAEYKRYKKIYWTLLLIGIVSVVVSFIIQLYYANVFDGLLGMALMGIAYATIISAIVLDYAKIRKLQKAHVRTGDGSKLTPKQLKHEQTKAEAAKQLEEAKKAQKESRRANSKIPLYRKPASSDAPKIGEPASIGQAAKAGVVGAAEATAIGEISDGGDN